MGYHKVFAMSAVDIGWVHYVDRIHNALSIAALR